MHICALQTAERSPGVKALATWKRYGFNVEQLLHAIGEGYYAAFTPRREGALRDYVKAAHRRGIRIILYHNTHLLPPDMPERHDEWCMRDANGEPVCGYGTFTMGCVTSSWGDWLVENAALACRCGVDGIFSDGPNPEGCHCDLCRAAFRESGATDDIPSAAFDRFGRSLAVRFMRRLYEAVKAVAPDVIVYQNLYVDGPDAQDFLPYNDLVGTEGGMLFYGPPARALLWKPSMAAKLLESVAGGKPTVVFAAADHKPWSLYAHAPSETKLLFAGSIANGANVWYGLHAPLDMLRGPSAAAAREITQFQLQHKQWYDQTESAARVALLHSPTSVSFYTTSIDESDFYGGSGRAKAQGPGDVSRSSVGFASMLLRSQIPFDFLLESATLDEMQRYGCIILPTCPCLSNRVARTLREYVAGGGKLIAACDVGFFNELGERRARPVLADVLGVTFTGEWYDFATHDYIEATARGRLLRGVAQSLMPAPRHGLKVRTRQGSVVARFHAPMPGRYVPLTPLTTPAIVLNRHGKGRALYLAGDFGEFYAEYSTREHARIVVNAATHFAKPRVSLAGAPASVEITHRRKRDGSADIVHLINSTGGMSRPISEVVPLKDLTLSVHGIGPIRSAVSLMTGRRLKPAADGRGLVRMALPELREYDVIVLKQ